MHIDLWLTRDWSRVLGDDLRVDIDDCGDWGRTP